ncbi:hypothetical protein QR64_01440 [Rhodococcus sp. Chr-9]|uniref:Helix-turn-helix domain-containing protein n=1 Tax=Rhodococcus pyridinivorans AK37 TaxID=1114960 RepID=H0JYE8_9NOCA|nr:hypothetical protein AK37_23964 [Rhodococcus pyridinivorans AK37]KHJ74419.1 hypothetical protein QR64_01440 [Rhodococcus sp. Chr-9]
MIANQEVVVSEATTESRYLRGDLNFEDALREVTGVDIGRDQLVQILKSLHTANPAGPALSEHDARVLTDAGFTASPAAATAARVDRDIRMANLVATSLSIADAAVRLGVTPARIRQRIADGTLWAFDSGRNRLLPPAQFTDSGAVPHLDKVMPHIPKDLHPLTVQTLLTQPQSSLVVDGRPVSIVAWLTGSAGTPEEIEIVVDVLAAVEWESA